MDEYAKLQELVKSLEGDFVKFYTKGNHSAGTRVRKGMQDVKALCQSIRVNINDIKGK